MKRKTPARFLSPPAARPRWQDRWAQMQADILKEAHDRQMREPWGRLFLYYSRAYDTPARWGQFLIVREGEEAPGGFELATPEEIPLCDRDGKTRWLNRFAGHLPMIGD